MSQSNFAKEIRAFAAQVQEIENAAFGVLVGRCLCAAIGYQLDIIAHIIGNDICTRDGLPDDEFRKKISAQIAINQSRGEPERMIMALEALTEATEQRLIECFPASFYQQYDGSAPAPTDLYKRMHKIKAAGVNYSLIRSDPVASFQFSVTGDATESDSSHGFSDPTQTTGGKFSELVT